jgi:hypothetical protein
MFIYKLSTGHVLDCSFNSLAHMFFNDTDILTRISYDEQICSKFRVGTDTTTILVINYSCV